MSGKFFGCIIGLVGLLGTSPVYSQRFGFGAGLGYSIRSPFFNMDVSPAGTQVYTPGAMVHAPNALVVPQMPPFVYGYPHRAFYPPSYIPGFTVRIPSVSGYGYNPVVPELQNYGADSTSVSGTREMNFLANSAGRLESAIAADPNGESWKDFLAPDQIKQFALRAVKLGAIDRSQLPQIKELHSRYEGTMNSREFAWVVRLSGFQEIVVTLGQLLQSQAPELSSDATLPQELVDPNTVPPSSSLPVIPENLPRSESRLEAEKQTPQSELLPVPNPISAPTRGSF